MLSPWPAWLRFLLLTPLALMPFRVEAESPLIVRVEMIEFAFHPATIRLLAGRPVTLVLVNRGQLAHQFETDYLRATPTSVVNDTLQVEVTGIQFVRLQPGTVARVRFLPAAHGRFSFACTIEGHQEAGMVGVLDSR